MHRLLGGAFVLSVSGAIATAATALQTQAEDNDASALWAVTIALVVVAVGTGIWWLMTRPSEPAASGVSFATDRQSGGQNLVAGRDINYAPPGGVVVQEVASFSVTPAPDGHYWLLDVTNDGSADTEFLVDVLSISRPVDWTRRFALPWRAWSQERNKASDGWRLIPTKSNAEVNIFQWLTKEEGSGIFAGEPSTWGRGPYYLRVFSVPHPQGHENFHVSVGDVLDVVVEVRARASANPCRFTYLLIVTATGLELREADRR